MNYKIRWYLESTLAVIYWSVAFMALFFSISFILEHISLSLKSCIALVIFFSLLYFSRRRVLVFEQQTVHVKYARFWKNQSYPYSQIEKIEIKDQLILLYLGSEVLEFKIKKKQVPDFQQKMAKDQLPLT